MRERFTHFTHTMYCEKSQTQRPLVVEQETKGNYYDFFYFWDEIIFRRKAKKKKVYIYKRRNYTPFFFSPPSNGMEETRITFFPGTSFCLSHQRQTTGLFSCPDLKIPERKISCSIFPRCRNQAPPGGSIPKCLTVRGNFQSERGYRVIELQGRHVRLGEVRLSKVR